MKKVIVIMALLASTSAYAHGPGGFGGFHGGGGGGFHGGGFGGFHLGNGFGGFHPGGGFRPGGWGGWHGGWNRPGWGGWRGPVVIGGGNNWGRPWGALPLLGILPAPIYSPPPPVYYDPPPPPPPVYYNQPPQYYAPPPPPPYYNEGPGLPDIGPVVVDIVNGILGPILQQFFAQPQYAPPPPPVYVPPPPPPPVYTQPRINPSYTQPRIEAPPPTRPQAARPSRAPAPIEPLSKNGSMNGTATCKTKDGATISIDLAMTAKTHQLTNFHVTFTLANGDFRDRTEQYNNIKLHNDKNTLYWEGDRAHTHMIGTLAQDGTYNEVLIDGGKREIITNNARCSEPTLQ